MGLFSSSDNDSRRADGNKPGDRSLGKRPRPPAVPLHRTVVTIAGSATRVPNPAYPPERTQPGIMARLVTEDWNEMTAAANSSPNHIGSDERWTKKAREANPSLGDDQAYRLGQMMKKQHFIKMGKLSAEARRIAREAAEELRGVDDAQDAGAARAIPDDEDD